MKKLQNFVLLIVAIVMTISLTNCKKDLKDSTPVSKQYVGTVEGTFNAVYGDISLAKSVDPSTPVAGINEWTMFRKDGSKVDGSEFITGSAAQKWWSISSNNPVTFPASQQVYSNLTPDEDVRLQLVVFDNNLTNPQPIYFGLVDFNPNEVNFPLAVTGYRLGDYLSLNADAISNLPGANLTITVTFGLAPVEELPTKNKLYDKSSAFGFDDIKYGTPAPKSVIFTATPSSPMGNVVLYNSAISNEIPSKVYGPITITITEAATSSTPESSFIINVPEDKFGKPGKGTVLILKTTKVGWYDSSTVGTTNKDITIDNQDVFIN